MTQNKTLTDEAFDLAKAITSFEVWTENRCKTHAELNEYRTHLCKEVWVAAKKETAKEIAELNKSMEKLVEVIAAGADLNISYRKTIAELESQLSILKPHPKCDKSCLLACSMEADAFEHEYNRATELQSQVNMLRDYFKDVLFANTKLEAENIATEAISATAPQSLIEHDNSTIERCALIVDDYCDCEFAAEQIRALKAIKE